MDKDSAKIEGLLKDLSRACKEAAAVATVWVRNTHHSLQRQEFRWEWLRQEVKELKEEVQTLIVEGRCIQQNHDRYEERLKQLEKLAGKHEQVLAEQGKRCETELRGGRLGDCSVSRSEGESSPSRLAQKQPTGQTWAGK